VLLGLLEQGTQRFGYVREPQFLSSGEALPITFELFVLKAQIIFESVASFGGTRDWAHRGRRNSAQEVDLLGQRLDRVTLPSVKATVPVAPAGRFEAVSITAVPDVLGLGLADTCTEIGDFDLDALTAKQSLAPTYERPWLGFDELHPEQLDPVTV
jgi:hypothetical protein